MKDCFELVLKPLISSEAPATGNVDDGVDSLWRVRNATESNFRRADHLPTDIYAAVQLLQDHECHESVVFLRACIANNMTSIDHFKSEQKKNQLEGYNYPLY